MNKEIFNPDDYKHEEVSEEQILNWFKMFDAAWEHDGNIKSPHAELSSGKCSNAFFDCMRVLCYPNISEILAYQLVKRLLSNGLGEKIDWVVGSSYAAITFSYEVARKLSAKHGFTEKDPDDPKKQMWRRLTIPKGSVVLQVEELITTSNTFREVRRAIEEGNSEKVNFLPFIGTIVHRPPKLPISYTINSNPIKVVSLIEKEVWSVEPEKCPLCEAGSPRYRPKTHWKELTGK
jgi:orotate phosphoribosyltransferase